MGLIKVYIDSMVNFVGLPYIIDQLPCNPEGSKSIQTGTLGRMSFSPGPVPLVTKDIQVRYLYGMGPMSSVTKYIRIPLSYLKSIIKDIKVWCDQCHPSLNRLRSLCLNKSQSILTWLSWCDQWHPAQAGTQAPFWRVGKEVSFGDPRKICKNFQRKLNSIVITHIRRISGYIGGRILHTYYTLVVVVFSPHILYHYEKDL